MASLTCTQCAKDYPLDTPRYQCECGGLFRLSYTPPAFSPALIDAGEWSLFRYRAFFPLQGELWREVTLGEGMTPTLRLDGDTWVKLDYAMPTLSFKDRGAALVLWLCRLLGVKRVIQDSSGNAGNSIAAYAAKAGIPCEIYVPKGTSPQKIHMIQGHGAQVNVFDGTRDQTADACRARAAQEDVYYASHVYNPIFYQGTKTFVYEIFEQLCRLPDNLFVPVGNGTLFFGVLLGCQELLDAGLIHTMPRIFAVQSERCDPLARAYEEGRPAPLAHPQATMAEGIAIGRPARCAELLELARQSGARFIRCREESILDARAALARRGYYVEHTTAATYGAYLDARASGALSGDSLIPLCGAGLKSDH